MRTKTDFFVFSEQQQRWQALALSERIRLVQNFIATLQRDPEWNTLSKTLDAGLHSEATIRSLLQAQMQQVETLLGESLLLPGVTGESNELYCVGRGITLLVATEHSSLSGLLLAIQGALLCGNSVLLWLDPRWFKLQSLLMKAWQVSAPQSVLASLSTEQQDAALLTEPLIEGTIYLGTEVEARKFNRKLAERDGSIITPVIESDPMNLSVLSRSDFLLRLVTERTCTINLTAIGGNASLMEQGVSHY